MRCLLPAAIALLLWALNGCWVNESISLHDVRTRVEKAPYVMPANIAVLGEREIREKIIGNTLVSNPGDEGMEVVEYLHPDGSVRSLWMNERAEGFWVVSRSLLCLYYPLRLLDYPPRSASLYHCFTLTLDADRVGFFDQDGRTVDIEILLSPGDARGF